MYVAIAMIAISLPVICCTVMSVHGHCISGSRYKSSRVLSWACAISAWFLGLMFVCGGMSKLMPFPGVMGPVWLEERLAEHGLGLFARFIAWSEAFIGILLLSRTTRVLGAIMMVPLLLNILMVTISMNWRGTPWVIGFFIQLNLFLLVFHFDRWKSVCFSNVTVSDARISEDNPWLALTCMGLVLAGPFWYAVHPYLAILLISSGFIVLIGAGWHRKHKVC